MVLQDGPVSQNGSHAELRASGLDDRALIEALGVAVYTTDADGLITNYNEAAAELWGRRPELGKDQWCGSWRLYFPDGRPMSHDECPMGITLRENRADRGAEAIAERPDGTRVWFVPYPTPIHDTKGNLVGAVNVLVDITDRKRAEEAAFYLNAIVASSDDAIVSKNLEGIVTSWNQGAERLFGYRADEMLGRSIRTIIPVERLAEEDDVLDHIRRGERVEHFETIRRRKDGSQVSISLTVSPVRDKDGRIIGASKIARDISQRRAAERALAEALEAKDEFLGLVSHELRTPITTITGNAQILVRGNGSMDDAARRSALEDIYQEAIRLNKIVADLLTLARLEKDQLETEPLALGRVVTRIVREYLRSSSRDITVSSPDEELITLGDENLIRQVLRNYVSNAEKYSPSPTPIEVIIDRGEREAVVRVLDRGIGVKPDEIECLFEPFYRSDDAAGARGLGIGLSVCQRLIAAVGGRVWAAPRAGGGSEFGFALVLCEDDAE